MRIASITIVKNDTDIIECFARHNINYVDKMYIIDDDSLNNTREILFRLSQENPAFEIVADGGNGGFHQGMRTTSLMWRAYAEEQWDFIIPLDSDEMICAADRPALEKSLAALPPDVAGGISAIIYQTFPSDDPSIADPLTRITTAFDQPEGHIFKAIATASLLKCPDLTFVEGNHALTIQDSRVPIQHLAGVTLAHFSLRSPDQIVTKCLKHYVAWRSRHDYAEYMASQPVAGVKALKTERHFAITADALIVRAYAHGGRKRRHRPFVERQGTLKWPELAVQEPYGELIALFDHLIARAKLSDQMVFAAGPEASAETLRALIDERNTLKAQLARLRGSTSELSAAYLRLFKLHMSMSLSKRRVAARAFIRRVSAWWSGSSAKGD